MKEANCIYQPVTFLFLQKSVKSNWISQVFQLLHIRAQKNSLTPWSQNSKDMCKHSVHTTNKIQHFSVTKINWLILFRKIIITVSSENYTKPMKRLCGHSAELQTVTVGGTTVTLTFQHKLIENKTLRYLYCFYK